MIMPQKLQRKHRRRHHFHGRPNKHHRCRIIKDIHELREHLQTAIEIEHATIPTYLCALYSIKEGTNTFAYQTIQAVVMEEMLHMILAANILNAVGGKPAINHEKFVPDYPTYLPHSDEAFKVHLCKFSEDAIDTFLKIEKPAEPGAPPEDNNWQTIGQFYAAIEDALEELDAKTDGGIFSGDISKQLDENDYYGGGGKLFAVTDLQSAKKAIGEIVGQGEGINHDTIIDTDILFGEEIDYAHYFKFNEIKLHKRYCPTDKPNDSPSGPDVEVDYNNAYNMQLDPKMSDYPEGSQLWQKSREFNLTYTKLLDCLHDTCNGQKQKILEAVPLMYDLKYKAQDLMRIPYKDGMTAGPSFEFIRE